MPETVLQEIEDHQGILLLYPYRSSHHQPLQILTVTETHRGSGVADDIMDRLREIAQDHSCSAIRWDTHTTNERARRFHERYAKNTNWVTYEMSTNSK